MADFTSKRSFEDCPKKHKNIIHIYEVVLFLFGNTVFYNFYSDLYSTLLTSDKACHKSSLTTLPYLFSFKYFFIPVIKSSSPSQLLIIRTIEAPYNINTEITIIYVILKSKQYRIVVFTSLNIIVNVSYFIIRNAAKFAIRNINWLV